MKKPLHNVVYTFMVEPCKYNGDSFNQQQLNIIHSIPACNAIHNTIKIGSSRDVEECVNKIRNMSELIQFGRLVVFVLECPANAVEYFHRSTAVFD